VLPVLLDVGAIEKVPLLLTLADMLGVVELLGSGIQVPEGV
jgi:hypothetical protein